MKEYTGAIIAESLQEAELLQRLHVLETEVTDDDNPDDRWHLYTVRVSREEIAEIMEALKPGPWYAHFWIDRQVLVAFKDRVFALDYDNKETWTEALDHGRSTGIPEDQLDFTIN